jgi:YD repeat-containing protein
VRGRLVRTIYPDGSQEVHTYDLAGQRQTTIELNGSTTRYVYNNAGQLLSVTSAEGTGDQSVTQYVYDLVTGLQTTMIDPRNHPTRFTYDELSRQVRVIENYVDGSFNPAFLTRT